MPPGLATRLAEECLLLADYVDWMQEKDLLANHWLKNLRALALCDWLLSPNRDRAARACEAHLLELERQVLPDGAHYELCPMYHAEMVTELVMFRHLPGLPEHLLQRLGTILESSEHWLSLMSLAPGQWANFNDSWLVPRLTACLRVEPDLKGDEDGLDAAKSSGFVRLQSKAGWRALLDAGSVSPEFNPAHSHSDVLSVIAAFRGNVVIQDPGVLHYSPNDERAYLKSARAHNGPCLADRDHTEILGSFRIGRAASGRIVETSYLPGLSASALGEHRGYAPLTLQRRLSLKGAELRLEDTWQSSPASLKFRPWLRLLLRTTVDLVREVHFDAASLSLEFSLPIDKEGQVFRLLMRARGRRKMRWYVGEAIASEEYGRTVPTVELVATDEATAEPLK